MSDGNSRIAWAVIYGTSATVLGFVVLMAIGGLIGWLGPSWSSHRSVIEAALIWATISAIFAYAGGGWIAGRTWRGEEFSIKPGLLVGMVAVIIAAAPFIILTNRYGDLRSIAIELGLIDVQDTGPIDAPFFDAEGDPVITPSDRAYIVLIETGLYLLGMAGLLIGAAILGALGASWHRLLRGASSQAEP